MNLIITFCVVCFVMCFGADHVGTQETQEENLDFTASMCPSADARLLDEMKQLGENCYKKAVPKSERVKDENPFNEDRGNYITRLCQGQISMRNCLAETNTNIKVCKNVDFLKTFEIYRGAYEKLLEIGCSDNGENLAFFFNELKENMLSTYQPNPVTTCFDRFHDFDRFEIDITTKFFHIHRELKELVQCLHQGVDVSDSIKEGVQYYLGEIIETLKCVHPDDGTLVPCGTIDASSVASNSVCDIYLEDKKARVGTVIPIYDILEENMGLCVMSFLRYSDSKMVDSNSIRDEIGSVCETKLKDQDCFSKSQMIAEVCLDDTEIEQFNLLGDFVYSAVRIVCSDERFTEVLAEVYRLKNNGRGNAISDCVAEALDRNVIDAHRSSSKNMRFYHEMEAFKECLLNKLQRHQSSIYAATLLINDMLKEVKCVHPTGGTEVPCETLHTHTA